MAELGQFVQEKHPVVGQADLAGLGMGAAANEAGSGRIWVEKIRIDTRSGQYVAAIGTGEHVHADFGEDLPESRGCPCPLRELDLLAVLFNQLESVRFKRVVQSISYFPHFVSTVIIVGLLLMLAGFSVTTMLYARAVSRTGQWVGNRVTNTKMVDVRNGHKTGFYLDQRDNRHHVTPYATDSDVLNCFCYTGGFGVAAMAAGARTVTNIDVSATALDLAQQNMALNNLDSERVEYLQADVFKQLRSFRDAAREFDVIILDPPKFADSKQQLDHASRGYKDINLLAVKLLRAGGYLFTFSCSGLMEPALFQKIVADAALDAGRDAQIIGRMGQAADHPTSLAFPEGHYLKGLLCRVW